jgi:hypothetical protein
VRRRVDFFSEQSDIVRERQEAFELPRGTGLVAL